MLLLAMSCDTCIFVLQETRWVTRSTASTLGIYTHLIVTTYGVIFTGGFESPITHAYFSASFLTFSAATTNVVSVITHASALIVCYILVYLQQIGLLGLPTFRFVEEEAALGHLLGITLISIVVMVRSRNFCELMTNATVQAQLANETKSRFLATVSHEIRTPLTTMLGWTEILLSQYSPSHPEMASRLESVKTSGEHLLAVINDLLDYSKMETGKLDLENEVFDITSTIEAAVESTRVLVDRKVKFISCIDITQNRYVSGDSHRLIQVIINFISNAAKFTREGHVEFRVFEKEASTGRMKTEFCFSVSDTGIGMDETTKLNLFKPFVQADSSMSRRYGGTGLGLSICRELVERMGGSILVESALGEGTTFSWNIILDVPLDRRRSSIISRAELNRISSIDFDERIKTRSLSSLEEPPTLSTPFTKKPSPPFEKRTNSPTLDKKPPLKKKDSDEPLHLSLTDVRDHKKVPIRILLAEDNRLNQKLIQTMLASIDYEVSVVSNGEEAVKACTSQGFDVILMDFQMPVMDGLTAARTLKRLGCKPPIIGLTANADEQSRKEATEVGMSQFVRKPMKTSELRLAIEAALEAPSPSWS